MVDTESNPKQPDINEKSTNDVSETSHDSSNTPGSEVVASEEQHSSIELNQSIKEVVLNKELLVEEALEALKDQIKNLNSEKKAAAAVEAMRYTLEKGKTGSFKLFWDVRKLCLDLFKEKISPAVRANLWNDFRELSKEAKLLKEVLDEDSAFAVEQLDIAINALSAELVDYQPMIKDAPMIDLKGITSHIASFRLNLTKYISLQKELGLLNTFAVRVKSLRKELIETEMRIRQKNEFFGKLSSIGDAVFPRRKELIKQLSDTYSEDVDQFVTSIYPDVKDKVSSFHIRETIKSLQSLAKELTLDPKTFKKSRTELSKCWDELKVIDKEKRQQHNEIREEQKEAFEEVQSKVTAALEKLESDDLSESSLLKQINDLHSEIQETRFVKSYAIELKNMIKPMEQKQSELREKAQDELQKRQEEKLQQRKKEIEDFKSELNTLLNSQDQSYEEMKESYLKILDMKSALKLTRFESMDIEAKLFELKSLMTKKHEEFLLSMPEKDQLQLQNLQGILAEKQEQLSHLKDKIDSLKKQKSVSGLDFEQALQYEELLNQQKEIYGQLTESINSTKKQIKTLKNG